MRSAPRLRSSSRKAAEEITSLSVSYIDWAFCGSKYIAASPATSGKQLALLRQTGQLLENASSMGIPKPS